MQESQEVMESIRALREKLKAVNRENKRLKEELRVKQGAIDSRTKKLKSDYDDARFVQKFLYGHLGAVAVKRGNDIDVYFKPHCSSAPQKEYLMVLKTLGKTSWQVAGYNLPLSATKRVGIKIQSMEELRELIQEVTKEVQAYAERKHQITLTEELFKEVEASIQYTTKLQSIYLSLPMTLEDTQEKTKCEIVMNYNVTDTVPYKVTTNVSGLEEDKKKKLRKRMSQLLQHYPLFTVMKQEYKADEATPGESMLSGL